MGVAIHLSFSEVSENTGPKPDDKRPPTNLV